MLTLDALLADSATLAGKLQEVFELIVAKNAQLIDFGNEIQANELEAGHDNE